MIRNERIIFRKEGDGAYLFDPDSGKLVYANRTGALLFELCNGSNTEEEITAQLAAAYNAPGERLEQDIQSFLTSMLERSFLKRESADTDKLS
ncbi:MAG: PqqD family protein [Syntrophales bacterium]